MGKRKVKRRRLAGESEPKKFYIGKGIQGLDQHNSPVRGVPNTNIDFYLIKNGQFQRRRLIGADGRASVDLDEPHKESQKPHAHTYNWESKDKIRSDHQELTKSQAKILQKARRKRKSWDKYKKRKGST